MNVNAEQYKMLKEQIQTLTQISRRMGYMLRDLDKEIIMLDRQLAVMSHPAGKNINRHMAQGEVYEGLSAVLPFEPPNQKDN